MLMTAETDITIEQGRSLRGWLCDNNIPPIPVSLSSFHSITWLYESIRLELNSVPLGHGVQSWCAAPYVSLRW